MLANRKLWSAVAGLLFLVPVVAWSVESLGVATHHGHAGQCSHCGCSCACQKVCRLICETKEVKKTTYSCKCEDFCVPGPSQKCATNCNCGKCKECREAACIPTAAYIKTKKIPVKHEQIIQKPNYRWVVEYVCPKCSAK